MTLTDSEGRVTKEEGDPFEKLRELTARYRAPVQSDLPPLLAGGAVGYMGYDTVRHIEDLPSAPPDVLGLPDMCMCFYDTMFVLDHINNAARIVCSGRIDGRDLEEVYSEVCSKIDDLSDRLCESAEISLPDIVLDGEPDIGFYSNFDPAAFEGAVYAGKEYIAAGDIIQVVLSQRLTIESPPDPYQAYRALRLVNPSPYMFQLKMGDLHIVGSSPEVMVRLENGTVTVRPIAGTRRRGKCEEEDRDLAEELLADPKERAEHAMLLDLGRNDVGRIADFGSVQVTEEMVIERYSHVMHITSNVEGSISSDRDAVDVLRSCLPAGTVSGAPKVRAMEIIDELEPDMRGPYAGAVGYLDFSGNMDTCIAIRTLVFDGDKAHLQVGAGIVADSVPEKEFQETLNKAAGMLKALQVASEIAGDA